MDLSTLPSSVVQILYLSLSSEDNLKDENTAFGKAWHEALQEIILSEGCHGLRWGRLVEEPQKAQVHVIRESLAAHKSYLASASYQRFLHLIRPALNLQHQEPKVRHVEALTNYTSKPTTPFRAPVTGTAIYLSTTSAWHEGAWPCWTHVVRHVKGCTGIAGGKVLEPIDAGDVSSFAGISAPRTDAEQAYQNCFIVYVGWDSIKHHNDYHHTKHFRDHGVILGIGNEKWREYGHIRFEGWLEASSALGPKL